MDKEYVKIGETSNYEDVYKIGLVFDDGRLYSVEKHQGKKGTYITKEDVTRQVLFALLEEKDKADEKIREKIMNEVYDV